jgi:hypothetical protein
MPPRYKFVEVAPVTDATLEEAVNAWVAQGWALEGIRFVVTEHSKRPQIAFVSFVREGEGGPASRVGVGGTGSAGGAGVQSGQAGEAVRPRPFTPPEGAPRVITSPQGDDVE